jgi:hypothetical protein
MPLLSGEALMIRQCNVMMNFYTTPLIHCLAIDAALA